jgi:AbrB family looped-hinge helix DNA binding protein
MEATYGTIEKSGRLVIPAAFRKRLGLTPGTRVTLILDETNNQVTVSSRKAALKRMQDYFSSLRPSGELWSEELIRERRKEGAREKQR